MADIDGAYCSLEDIEAITLPARPYTPESRPTSKQISMHAKYVRRTLDQQFRGKGINLPVVEEEALETVRYINALGTASWIVNTLHHASEPNQTQFGQWLTETYNHVLETFLNTAKLKPVAVNEERPAIPLDDLESKIADIWDIREVDTTDRGSWFKVSQEW